MDARLGRREKGRCSVRGSDEHRPGHRLHAERRRVAERGPLPCAGPRARTTLGAPSGQIATGADQVEFSVEPEVFVCFVGMRLAVVVAHDVDNRADRPAIAEAWARHGPRWRPQWRPTGSSIGRPAPSSSPPRVCPRRVPTTPRPRSTSSARGSAGTSERQSVASSSRSRRRWTRSRADSAPVTRRHQLMRGAAASRSKPCRAMPAATRPTPDHRLSHRRHSTRPDPVPVVAASRVAASVATELPRFGDEGWRATFSPSGRAHSVVSGSAWEATPWRAVQRAAWEALG